LALITAPLHIPVKNKITLLFMREQKMNIKSKGDMTLDKSTKMLFKKIYISTLIEEVNIPRFLLYFGILFAVSLCLLLSYVYPYVFTNIAHGFLTQYRVACFVMLGILTYRASIYSIILPFILFVFSLVLLILQVFTSLKLSFAGLHGNALVSVLILATFVSAYVNHFHRIYRNNK
jgi:hypothetical protein